MRHSIVGMTAVASLLVLGRYVAADTGWVSFVEPAEHAFTIDVPQGWRAAAVVPLARPTASATLSSPDGATWISFNDPRLMPLLNYPVGNAPAVLGSIPYTPAPYVIMGFGATLVGEQCGSPKLERVRLRDDVAKGIDAIFSGRAALGGETLAADAVFSCNRAGRPSLAYMALATHLYPLSGLLRFWQIDTTEIALAPSQELATAVSVMSRSVGSVEWSSSWLAVRQAAALGQTQAAIRGLDQVLHDSHMVDNIINGVGDFFNPATDRTIQAPAGYQSYCQNAAGAVFGSSSGAVIKPDCQPLSPVR